MHQNIQQACERSVGLPACWTQHPTLPEVICNVYSKEELDRRIVRLARSEAAHQIGLMSGRANNRHPFVCRVHFFHTAPTLTIMHRKVDYRQIHVYTDRMIELQPTEWTLDRIAHSLVGLKRLSMLYGPFVVTEKLIRKNQVGDIRVWVSEFSEICRPDYPIAKQEQMIDSLAKLLSRYNTAASTCIMGCHSLREALERVELLRKANSPMTGYMHYKSGSNPNGNIKTESNPPYFNVFQGNYSFSKKKAHSPISIKKQPQFPSGPGTVKPQSQHSSPGLMQKKVMNTNGYLLKVGVDEDNGSRERERYSDGIDPFPSHFTGEKEKKRREEKAYNGASHFQVRRPLYTYQSRFATDSNFTPPITFAYPGSPNPTKANPFQDNSLPNNKKSIDITIINNNISNYINPPLNIPKDRTNNIKSTKIQQFTWPCSPSHSPDTNNVSQQVNNLSQQTNGKVRKNAPSFLAQKNKQLSSYSREKSPVSKNKSMKGPTCPKWNQLWGAQSSKKVEKSGTQDMLYTLNYQPKISTSQKYPNLYVPKLAGQVCERLSVTQYQDKYAGPYRTKTTNFLPTKNENHTISPITIIGKKQTKVMRLKTVTDQRSPTPQHAQLVTAKSVDLPEQVGLASGAKTLKNQLKLQFGNVLGGSLQNTSNLHEEKLFNKDCTTESKKQLLKESLLQDRIKQKQEAFAELKKEALKVLTDL